ncbi:hypothetical protein HTZ85_26035 [Escherichia coli]|nr:hypothetical protein [Escherichia coli]
MACGGHWHTTPAQVKTEKTARHPQSKKVKFLHFFSHLFFRADLVIMSDKIKVKFFHFFKGVL